MKDQTDRKIIANIVNIKISSRPHAWNPPTDLIETDLEFIIRIEVAGLDTNDLTISVERDVVTIVGHRELAKKECAYHRIEIPYGEFRSRVDLPSQVDVDRTEAEYDRGFLSILLPKALPQKVRINKPEGI